MSVVYLLQHLTLLDQEKVIPKEKVEINTIFCLVIIVLYIKMVDMTAPIN